jgi:hypothetical protein
LKQLTFKKGPLSLRQPLEARGHRRTNVDDGCLKGQ